MKLLLPSGHVRDMINVNIRENSVIVQPRPYSLNFEDLKLHKIHLLYCENDSGTEFDF